MTISVIAMHAGLATLLFVSLFFVRTCGAPSSPSKPVASSDATEADAKDDRRAEFESTVLPLLQRKCVPCHFPGGKMYDKLPFDDPRTILGHSEAIGRRFRAEEEKRIIAAFVAKANGE